MWIAFAIVLLLVLCGVAVNAAHRIRERRLATQLLFDQATQRDLDEQIRLEEETDLSLPDQPFVQRRHSLPWMMAAVAYLACFFLAGLRWPYCLALAAWTAVLTVQVDVFRYQRAQSQIESQLSRGIDYLVSAIRAGSSLPLALEQVVSEIESPLHEQLNEVVSRIRYGDQPQAAMTGLVDRVPLETFNLFSTCLAVHWEVGGSLAQPLSNVARTIRDRIQIKRRIQNASVQARFSMIAIMLVTYAIFVMMWVNDVEIVGSFMATQIGQFLISGALVLQAVGLQVITHMSQTRV